MTDKEIYKLIKENRVNIEQNLLKTNELSEIKEEIKHFLDDNIIEERNNILFLQYRKFKDSRRKFVLWSNTEGYVTNAESFIKSWIDFFEQYLSSKKIKKRFEDNKFWIETRTEEDKDEHILIGERDYSKEKAHLIIDRETGVIRIENKQKLPEEFLNSVETVLTLKNGKKILTRRGLLEELPQESNVKDKSEREYPIIEVLVESSVPDFKKCNGINILIENKSSFPLIILECTFDGVLTNHGSQKLSQGRDVFHFDSINKNNIIDGFKPEFILKVRTQAGQNFLFKSVLEIRKTGNNYELCVPGTETVEGIN